MGAIPRAEGRRRYDALVFAARNGAGADFGAHGGWKPRDCAASPFAHARAHIPAGGAVGAAGNLWRARYQCYVRRVLTGVTPGLYIHTSLALAASIFYRAIVRACSFAMRVNARRIWMRVGGRSRAWRGTTGFTVSPWSISRQECGCPGPVNGKAYGGPTSVTGYLVHRITRTSLLSVSILSRYATTDASPNSTRKPYMGPPALESRAF